MCTHRILTVNKRTGRPLYVKCGRCKACLQEKANKRTARIRNHEQTTGRICLFITLTYDNRYIPYIRPSELSIGGRYYIYRDYDVRFVRKGHKYKTVPVRRDGYKLERYLTADTSQQREFFNNDGLKQKLPLLRKLNYETRQYENIPDKVGVCYYKDFQDFYKRFEIGFKREYGYRPTRSYYVCSEYGETYRRSHFHILLFCRPEEKEKIERHVRKAWQFTGNRKKCVDIQIARNVASYVSSYVNCGSDFPDLLRLWFKPKAVMSFHFGHDNQFFHLDNIVRMFEQNDWSYPCTRHLEGRSIVQHVPLPRYVLGRWFPQITGYARLPANVLFKVAHSPLCLDRYREKACIKLDELSKQIVRLSNAKQRFWQYWFQLPRIDGEVQYGATDYEYFYAYVWSSYIAYVQRWSYENYDVSDTWFNYYENIGDVIDNHTVRSDLSDVPLPVGITVHRHPDLQPWNVRLDQQLSELYDKKKKQAKVSNLAMTDGLHFDV